MEKILNGLFFVMIYPTWLAVMTLDDDMAPIQKGLFVIVGVIWLPLAVIGWGLMWVMSKLSGRH